MSRTLELCVVLYVAWRGLASWLDEHDETSEEQRRRSAW